MRDFTIGLTILPATYKTTICGFVREAQVSKNIKTGFVIEAQVSKNIKTAITMSVIRDTLYAGTTKEKRFYKTLTMSLKDTRPDKDNDARYSVSNEP